MALEQPVDHGHTLETIVIMSEVADYFHEHRHKVRRRGSLSKIVIGYHGLKMKRIILAKRGTLLLLPLSCGGTGELVDVSRGKLLAGDAEQGTPARDCNTKLWKWLSGLSLKNETEKANGIEEGAIFDAEDDSVIDGENFEGGVFEERIAEEGMPDRVASPVMHTVWPYHSNSTIASFFVTVDVNDTIWFHLC
ncbi:hypothetical protein AOQ84DRAFT_364836 [Glonium stellatum]|uniref:Uncharacterized protein n=1 Tax=Glonium stellatum TaxID=574774 RepID=A0A8E2JS73_9PEZI|nr:hypothetical protein AOQ84DRAFT_364836 [Glonium stellatum]